MSELEFYRQKAAELAEWCQVFLDGETVESVPEEDRARLQAAVLSEWTEMLEEVA